MTTFSASLTNLTILLPQSLDCCYLVWRRIVAPPPFLPQKHTGLRSDGCTHASDWWHQTRLSNVTRAQNSRLRGINLAVPCLSLSLSMLPFLFSVQYVIFKEGIMIELLCRIAASPCISVTRTTLNFIIVQQDATYSVYYISVGSSTCLGFWHPSSGARTAVITASGIDKPHLLPSALVVVPTQQRERMVVEPIDQYQKL